MSALRVVAESAQYEAYAMKTMRQVFFLSLMAALIAGCTPKIRPPEPSYYRDSPKFRRSMEVFAKENNKPGNKITKEEVIAKFGEFDKETSTEMNGMDTPVSVYYSQEEDFGGGESLGGEYVGGKYTGFTVRDFFYVFHFEDGRLKTLVRRTLEYRTLYGVNLVEFKDRTKGPIIFGIEKADNPKWRISRKNVILAIR